MSNFFSALSESEITRIHYATIDILKNTGSNVFNDEALDLLRNAGCKVSGNLVKVPPHIVEKAIFTAPKQITIFNRNGKAAMLLEDKNIYFGTGPTTPFSLDVFTGERRMTTVEDIVLHTKVAESLRNVDFVMPMGSATDVPKEISDIHEFVSTVKHTVKPIPFITWNKKNLKTIIEIASIFSGGLDNLVEKPFIIQFSEPTSPLTHTKDAVDKLLYSAEVGIPTVYFPCNTMGGTGPMSIYGSIIQSNAESLLGLVLSQLKREGTPFIIGGCGIPLNMSNGLISVGAPEYYLTMSAYAQVCQYYKIPMFGLGGMSDSKIIDEQSAIEMTLCTFMSALSGINMIDGLAQLESCMLGSIEMVVLLDEVIEFIKRLINGIDTSDMKIRGLIDKVGPGGQYVSEEHTLKNFRSIWFPTLFDRNNFSRWREEGSLNLKQRLNKKTREIIYNFQTQEPTKDITGAIDQIMSKYNYSFKGKRS
jgi:trimethylamine---corrinoid protein Co-methyltransferase